MAAAILDYVDLGADLISIRGYDNLNDLIDYGRYVLPLVRQELAHREATGQPRHPAGRPPRRLRQPPAAARREDLRMTTAPAFDSTIPATASPEVEFISLSHLNPSTELNPIPTRGIDLKYFRRYVRSLEEGGYDYTLLPYGATTADSFVVASAVGQLTEHLGPSSRCGRTPPSRRSARRSSPPWTSSPRAARSCI